MRSRLHNLTVIAYSGGLSLQSPSYGYRDRLNTLKRSNYTFNETLENLAKQE